ncbi:MAG: PQQ-binding-like beta-propeller repeat protein, partial [Acidobacteriota bacterium]
MIRESSTPSLRPRPTAVAGSLLLLLLATSASASTIWNGLRGPNFDGAVDGQLLQGDAPALEVAWKRDLGSGYSSVVVADGRVIATFASGDADVMAAFSTEDGEELWRYRFADTYVGHDGSHDGPISTPALDGSTVVGFGPRGELFALDTATGKELWKIDVIEKHAAKKPHYGFTSSPVISDGVVVVALGGAEDNAFAGFSMEDGSLAWKLGEDSINYHSPVLATIGGKTQVLASGSTTLHGIAPASGEILWSHQHDGDQSAMGGGTIVPIPAGENRIFLMNKNDSSTMVRVTPGDDGYAIEELWSNNSLKTSYVIPAVRDGYIYGISGRILTAVDAATGERVWRSREPGDGFPTVVG